MAIAPAKIGTELSRGNVSLISARRPPEKKAFFDGRAWCDIKLSLLGTNSGLLKISHVEQMWSLKLRLNFL